MTKSKHKASLLMITKFILTHVKCKLTHTRIDMKINIHSKISNFACDVHGLDFTGYEHMNGG